MQQLSYLIGMKNNMLELKILIGYFVCLALSYMQLRIQKIPSKEAKLFTIIIVSIIFASIYIYAKFFYKRII